MLVRGTDRGGAAEDRSMGPPVVLPSPWLHPRTLSNSQWVGVRRSWADTAKRAPCAPMWGPAKAVFSNLPLPTGDKELIQEVLFDAVVSAPIEAYWTSLALNKSE